MNPLEVAILYGSDCLDRVEPALRSRYASLVEQLWQQLRPNGSSEPSPELLVVHSPVARPMSVRSSTGTTLVYDQYLGQAFSRLTRLALSDAPPEMVDAYIFKLYGQRLLVRGRCLEAAAFGVVASWLKKEHGPFDPLIESEEKLTYRLSSTTVQEAFAIAHELMHVVLADEDMASDLAQMYISVVEENVARVRRAAERGTEDFHVQYLADVTSALERRGLDASKVATAIDPVSLRGDGDEVAEHLMLLERADVQREGMCDLYGAIAVAEVLDVPGMNYLDVMATATLGVQHLRVIQLLDQIAAGGPEDVPGFELSQSMARTSLLRTGLGVSLAVSLHGHEEETQVALNELQAKTVHLNRAHTSVILDQLLYGLDLPLLGHQFLAVEQIATVAATIAADEASLRSVLGFH